MNKPDIRVLVGVLGGASLDGASGKLILQELNSIASQVSGKRTPRVKVGVNIAETRKLFQQQMQAIASGLDIVVPARTKLTEAVSPLKMFDTAALEKEGRRYYQASADILEHAKRDLASLGRVDITDVFKTPQGEIQRFAASVKNADGIIERFHFKLAELNDGMASYQGFVQTNSVLTDRTAGTGLENTLNYLTRVETKLADITSRTLISSAKPLLPEMEEYGQYTSQLQAVKTRVDELKLSTANLSDEHRREIDRMVADLQRYAKELQTAAYAGGDLKAQTFSAQKAQLQAELENSIKQWTVAGIYGGNFEQEVTKAKALLDSATDSAGLDVYTHKLKLLKAEFQGFKLDGEAWDQLTQMDTLAGRISVAQLRIQNLKKTYSAFTSDPHLVQEWQTLFDQSKVVGTNKELTNLNARIGEFEQKLISAGKNGVSATSQLATNFKKMASWMMMGTAVAALTRGVRGIYEAVVDVDTAMVELRKVTNETSADYERFLDNAAKRAKDIGAGLSDLIQATANFARLGEYDLGTAEYLGEVATIYKNVGDEVKSVDDATNSIISTMKAFQIAESGAMSIVDKFNEVGNNFAITSGGIGEALSRSASSLALANNTLDESIGLIVAANNVVQNPDTVGTMWKTTTLRIRGAKTELEAAGLETEKMAESTSKLRDLVSGLTGGFDIMADNSTFKSTYEIIKGISKVWDNMADIDQASLLELLAGKRNSNALAAAITNFADAEKAMKAAAGSSGSAMIEHNKWLDSIGAKQQQFSAQFQEFANTVLDSDLIKFAFDSGTGLLGFLTAVADKAGTLPPLLAAVSGAVSASSGKGLFQLDPSKNWLGSGTGITTALGMSRQAMEEFTAQIETDYQSLLKWEENVAQGKISIDDFNAAMGGASDQARTYATTTKGAAGSAVSFKVAQDLAAESSQKMGFAATAASIGVKALNMALNMAVGFAVAMAFQAVVTAIDKIVVSAKEQAEIFADLKAEYSEVSSEVASLESELTSVRDRIEELNKLALTGTLTPDQSKELDTLKQTNAELERKLEIERRLAKIKHDELEAAAAKSLAHTTYTSITGTKQQVVSYEGVIVEETATLSGSEMIHDLLDGMDQVKQKQTELDESFLKGAISKQEYSRQTAELDETNSRYETRLAEVIAEQQQWADAIDDTSGPLYEAKQLILEAIDRFLGLDEAVVGASGAIEKFSVEAQSFESICSKLNLGMEAITTAQEDMAETGYLSADSVKALKEAGLEQYLVACEKGYKLTAGALSNYLDLQQDEYENALNKAKTAAIALVDTEEGKTRAINGTTKALINQLKAQQATMQAELRSIVPGWAADAGYTKFGSIGVIGGFTAEQQRLRQEQQAQIDAIQDAIDDVMAAEKNLDEFERARATVKRDYTKTNTNTTDKNKAAFEKLYDQWKHDLDMEKITLKEFNDWLDGNDGYKKYFSDRTKYAAEWRRYEKEVFDNSMQLHDQEVSNIDHTIEMLKAQNASEQDVLAAYREKQTLLENARNLVYDFLKAQGLSDEQIASNGTLQELSKALLENPSEATDFRKERVDQRVSDFEHEIDMLERRTNAEDELIAKYREKQGYLIGALEEYRDALTAAGKTADEIAQDDWVQELTEQIYDLNDAVGDSLQDVFDRTSDNLHELLELTEDMIRHEREEEIKAIEERKDAYSDVIDAKKEMLRLTREEQEYNDKVSESTKSIAKVQSRIDALKLDDSRQAALERGKLEEELAELQRELADTQKDHHITRTEEALNKEEEEYHDLMDAKIKDIENFLDDNEAMTNAALQRLDNANETLFAQLESYAKHYTDTTGAELKSMWEAAMSAAKKYGDFTEAFTAHSDDSTYKVRNIVSEMRANGDAWGKATTDAGRKTYEDANVVLGNQISNLLGVPVWRENGMWYIKQDGKTQKLYDVYGYHTGGVVGDVTSVSPKADELFALLQKDEVVMSRHMVNNTFDFLNGLPKVMASAFQNPLTLAAQAVGGNGRSPHIDNLNLDASVSFDGKITDKELIATLQQYPRKVAEIVSAQIRKL